MGCDVLVSVNIGYRCSPCVVHVRMLLRVQPSLTNCFPRHLWLHRIEQACTDIAKMGMRCMEGESCCPWTVSRRHCGRYWTKCWTAVSLLQEQSMCAGAVREQILAAKCAPSAVHRAQPGRAAISLLCQIRVRGIGRRPVAASPLMCSCMLPAQYRIYRCCSGHRPDVFSRRSLR